MAHQRQNIRHAAQAQLLGATAAQDRVLRMKRTPWKTNQLPGISVYTLEESVDQARTLPRELDRTVQLKIEGALALADDIDDALDALALEIENAVHADPTFGETAEDSYLAATDIVIDATAEQPVGSVVLTYNVRYYTPAVPA